MEAFASYKLWSAQHFNDSKAPFYHLSHPVRILVSLSYLVCLCKKF